MPDIDHENEENFEVRFAKAGLSTKASAAADASPVAHPKITMSENLRDTEVVAEPEGQLTIDVYQTPDTIVIESAVAGVKPEDLDVSVSRDSITIRGERRREKTVKDEDYLYQECYWGRFSRSVILPQEVDPEGTDASFKNGVLRIELPKVNKQKTKKVKIKLE